MTTDSLTLAPALRPLGSAIARGWRRQCPACGRAELFAGYLRVSPECRHCGLPLHLHRADDAPPYFTIMIVGHIIVPAMLLLEQVQHPPQWLHLALWLPLTLLLTLWFLPRIKGSLIGFQWARGMHGFDGRPTED